MRYYDRTAINPTGNRENLTKCVVSVADFSGWHHSQCSRKRGHGLGKLLCKQHAKIAEAKRHLHIPKDGVMLKHGQVPK